MARYKNVRLEDVARAAGVSTTTVSHVVNSTRYVSAEVRERVEKAIADLGYSAVSRGAKVHGRSIGLAVTAASNPYVSDLILGVESECARAGYAMLLCDTHDDPVREHTAVASLLKNRVDGIVLGPTADWQTRTARLLARNTTPVVLVDRFWNTRYDQIGTESESSSYALVDHLAEIGHTRIAMVAGLPGLSTTVERVRGYRRALAAHGITHDRSLIQDGGSSVDGGRRATTQLLNRHPRPTALFVGNNAMTIGALLALAELGARIPDDIALVVFDDIEVAIAMQPPLTAAVQPFRAVGATAARQLIHRMDHPGAPRRMVRLPAGIEHRASCGCDLAAPDLRGVRRA